MLKSFLLTFLLLTSRGWLAAGPLFLTSYSASVTFSDDPAQIGVRTSLAYDGTSYWSVSGGGSGGTREARYDSSGTLLADYKAGIDFRSVFTDDAGNLYARGFNSRSIYQQTSPGVFSIVATLQDGTLNPQAAVVLNSAGTEYLSMNEGIVHRWTLAGVYIGLVTLQGYGTVGKESLYPQNRGLAVWDDYWLTYSDQVLSAWDRSGNRVDTATLLNAGVEADAYYSYSFANGMFFVEDDGTWRGYSLSAETEALTQAAETPEPATGLLLAVGAGALVFAWKRRRRALS